MFYRPSRMEIYTNNLIFNYSLLANNNMGNTRIMAVIKADAYGHGMLTVAQSLASAGCRHFAVATVDEALYLRACGFGENLLILGPTGGDEMREIIRQNLAVALTDAELARELSAKACTLGRAATVHLAVDTGMSRIGLSPAKAMDLLDELPRLPGLQLGGVFSHFATADEPDRSFMDLQFSRFKPVMLKASSLSPRPLFHIANSAAALREPRYRLDLCRFGMALYGFWPSPVISPRLPLKPTFAVKSCVGALRDLEDGTGVGYGLAWHADGQRKVAVVPMGYADGLSRSFSGKIDVLIGGRRCRQVGNICMDQMMVDVTCLPRVALGDEVVIVGIQGREQIRPEELAHARDHTIVYEIPIMFTGRVPRVPCAEVI